MGAVYKAYDKKLHRVVALKVLPNEYVSQQDRRRRFFQEARAASALNHPHILTVYEVGEDEGKPYIAMEYIEGETLRQKSELAAYRSSRHSILRSRLPTALLKHTKQASSTAI
jgi:serine/threonine protein kinase